MIVLWDLDGTIIDSGPEIMQRMRRVITEFGYPEPTPAQLRSFIGPPLFDSFATLMPAAEAERAVARSREIARSQDPGYLVELHTEVAQLIRELHAAGTPQAVASSKGQWLVELVLQHFDLAHCFAGVWGSDADRTDKPRVIAAALDAFGQRGVPSPDAVMIGDRIHDLEGARANGIPAIIVTWGYGDGEAVPGALARVDTVAELRPMLEA